MYFENAHHALGWSTEVLRRKRHPQINSIYRDVTNDHWNNEAKNSNRTVRGELPRDVTERYLLAIQVDGLLNKLAEEEQLILRRYYWMKAKLR